MGQVLCFATPDLEKIVREKALSQTIDPEHIALGIKYAEEIRSGYIPPVYVSDVSPEVGKGLYAEEPIARGSYVGEYGGQVRENNEHWEMNHYLYGLPVLDAIGRPYVIDATKGNLIRYINHSNSPNLIPKYAFIDGIYHVIFLSTIDIPAKSQLSYNYGKTYWKVRRPPKSL